MKLEKKYPILTPVEAKSELARKGWTNKALAKWWSFREEYVSRLINQTDRSRRDDDAIRGLPVCPSDLKD